MKNKENYDRIEAYLFGKMPDTEKAVFEKELQVDKALAEQFEE